MVSDTGGDWIQPVTLCTLLSTETVWKEDGEPGAAQPDQGV